MNLKELTAAFRLARDDVALPYLWSDDEIASYLSEAEAEAAVRASLLQDSSTPAVCQIRLAAGKNEYALSPLVFRIHRMKRVSDNQPIILRTTEWLDDNEPRWENLTGGPCHAVLSATGRIRFVGTPTEADTVKLSVYRLPLEHFKAGSNQCPEIAAELHMRMLDWAYRCAYLKHDCDAYDPNKAATFEAAFTRSFGERPDANVVRKQAHRTPTIVRPEW